MYEFESFMEKKLGGKYNVSRAERLEVVEDKAEVKAEAEVELEVEAGALCWMLCCQRKSMR